jgi:glycosyltransferase involved in cell wall biosynthesis
MINIHGYILIFSIDGGNKGGAEGVLIQIARYWLEKGYQIQVVFLSKQRGNQWELELGNDNINYSYFSIKTLRFLCRNKFEYTFTSHMRTNGFAGMLRSFAILHTKRFIGREPHSQSAEKGDLRTFIRSLYRFGYTSIDTLICQTEEMKEAFVKNNKRYTSIIKIISNPFDLNNAIQKEKEYITMPTDNPFIVSAGRFINEKGFDILINAFSILKQTCKDLKLVILGDGKLRSEIETLIKELNLENDVILYGFADNVYPFFKQARMCVVSSRIEGFPNVLLQEMSQNEKVVSTLCAGDIDKLQGVFTCKTHDEDDLLRAMDECLNADTTNNRELFDKELQNRSIEKFIERIKRYENKN